MPADTALWMLLQLDNRDAAFGIIQGWTWEHVKVPGSFSA